MLKFICPKSKETNCLLCKNEACQYCGAGCWNNNPQRNCQHGIITRHQPPSKTINFLRLPFDAHEWKEDS